ncbi:MAG: Omp28 family outer membrane lipoprotein [Flavobacteriales bacterium]|nr:Omp28 family outer membrane lipoprotein [Flavobacteriales bacterium]
MKKIFIPLLTALTVVFVGCDKIDNPIPSGFVSTEGLQWDDSSYAETNNSVRNFVLEEFTGQLCSNCPLAHKEIERLDSIYTTQFMAISYHQGAFANPNNGAPNDFRTVEGDDYAIAFTVGNWPSGTLSRLNNGSAVSVSQWDVDIQSIKNDAPKVKMGLSVLYNDSLRTAKAIITTEWLSTEAGNYQVQLQLVEDSITAYQLDGTTHVQNYIHRHLFRKSLNGTWGTTIPSSNLGDIDTQEFAIALDPTWNKDQCFVVAYVYKAAPNYEVLQAEELHLITH